LWRYKLLQGAARAFIKLLYKDVTVNTLRLWQPIGTERQLR